MFHFVDDCAEHFMNHTNSLVEKGKPIECRELAAKFTTDVIGVCALGLNISTNDYRVREFRKIAQELFADSWTNKLRFLNRRLQHWLALALKPIIRSEKKINFFVDTVKRTIDRRKANNSRRNDFIGNLMHLKDSPENLGCGTTSDTFLATQAFGFIVAGFEPSCITMSNAIYELALNPYIQEKLRREINAAYETNNGKLNYETVNNMQYLDQVFQETLRKYPPAFGVLREAVDDHMFEESRILITKGTKVFIPTYAIHHDPNIYPEPEKFDPKRFEEESVKLRHHMTFLPFGHGPRNCIGERFARNQIKLGLIAAIRRFKFDVCSKTSKVFKKRISSLLLIPKGDLYLKFEKISLANKK